MPLPIGETLHPAVENKRQQYLRRVAAMLDYEFCDKRRVRGDRDRANHRDAMLAVGDSGASRNWNERAGSRQGPENGIGQVAEV